MTIEQQITDKLKDAFDPIHLEIENESDMHSGPPGRESHFKVTLVSKKFDDLMLIKQHRMVNETLKTELSGVIHALALHTYNPNQWFERTSKAPQSPDCEGGGKS
ncbi:MAG TPA: BolA family transcriptional regulator [Gammaproteobacteria bacterium]|jgi:BolA protein|nr:BolA family transcriptional regulator [Gammaproteobacteria bacterium]